jgi:hypothetical protein
MPSTSYEMPIRKYKMKIWYGYGSEHSMNLVMIGEFKEIKEAKKAQKAIAELVKQAIKEDDEGITNWEEPATEYSREMSALLSNLQLYSVSPTELRQFAFDVNIDLDGNKVVISTDENDVQAFMKVLLNHGARIEVFSRHDYPEDEE